VQWAGLLRLHRLASLILQVNDRSLQNLVMLSKGACMVFFVF
jgi:hypothetical protein